MIYIDLILNLSLLVSISIISGFIDARMGRNSLQRRILQGILFAAAACVGMLKPMNLRPGLIFDGRSIVISLASLFFGTLAGTIAALPPLALRIWMGGSGMYMGILVILSSAATGLAFRKFYGIPEKTPGWLKLYLFGLAVHAEMVLCMIIALPDSVRETTLRNMALPTILIYPFATLLAGKILNDQVLLRLQVDKINESENLFRDALEFLPVPVSIMRADGSIAFMNHAFTEAYGYTTQDIPDYETWVQTAYPDEEYRASGMRIWEEDLQKAIVNRSATPSRIYLMKRKDGLIRQVNIRARPFGYRYLTVFLDMTDRQILETELRKKVIELAHTQEVTITSMAIIAEFRDNETGAHIQRTKEYVRCILEGMGHACPYEADVCERICRSAPLHDIGKVAIPDSILLKPGRLTEEEMELMKKHPEFGSQAIRKAQESIEENEFLNIAAEIAEFHHERWDGKGYPHGLTGTAIPLSARIMAIADVYDACISRRPYKEPIPHDEVVRIIAAGAGSHFDPELVKIFLERHDIFREISCLYTD